MRAAGQLATTGTRHPNAFTYKPAPNSDGKLDKSSSHANASQDDSLPICLLGECGKKVKAHGLCMTHYQQKRRAEKKAKEGRK